MNVLKRNSIRLSEVWLDEYAKYYYQRIGHDKASTPLLLVSCVIFPFRKSIEGGYTKKILVCKSQNWAKINERILLKIERVFRNVSRY